MSSPPLKDYNTDNQIKSIYYISKNPKKTISVNHPNKTLNYLTYKNNI